MSSVSVDKRFPGVNRRDRIEVSSVSEDRRDPGGDRRDRSEVSSVGQDRRDQVVTEGIVVK